MSIAKEDYIRGLLIELNNQGITDSKCDAYVRYATYLLDQNIPVLFDDNHVEQVLKLEGIRNDAYSIFELETANKTREICAPSKELKKRQRWILDEILEKFEVSNCANGFVKGKSIVTNAIVHVGQKYIMSTDLTDFFPSVTESMVENLFSSFGYSESAAKKLTELTCYDGSLPQGAPTSPCIANLVVKDIDAKLYSFAQEKNLKYSRYADDMTFSGNYDFSNYFSGIENIVMSEGFIINQRKTHMDISPHRQIVTGLLVTEQGVFVPRRYKRKFKQEIYYCLKYGVDSHLRVTGNGDKSSFKEYMYGKAYYIKMIEPELGRKYIEELNQISWGY